MSADKLHAIGDLPLQGFPRPGFDVLMAEQRFSLRPALNPLEQGAGLVPVRLAGHLGGIQVDMRLNKRRDRQPAASVQHLVAFVARLAHRRDLAKAALYQSLFATGRRGLPGVRSELTKAALLSYHLLHSIWLVFCPTPIAAHPILVHKISKKEKASVFHNLEKYRQINYIPIKW